MQVEQVVNTLKKDLPTLFEKDISYDIYSQDIYFQDPGYSTYKLNKDCLIYEHIDTWDRSSGEILKQFIRKGGES
nr:DUF2358 domain-containing protein [Argonema antarcticum]